MDGITPLRFSDDTLHLLDQRLLPLEERWLSLATLEETALAIEEMVVRGAPAIGCSAAYGYFLGVLALTSWPGDEASFRVLMAPAAARLRATRPTAVNLFWAIDRMEEVPWSADRGQCLAALRERADTITSEDYDACVSMGDLGADRLTRDLPPGPIAVLTHCNAGALATAGYGTALGVIRSLHRQGRLLMAYSDDTRPRQQGARLTVWELHRDGIPVTLVPDTAAGHLLKTGRIAAVVVGADRIAANGDAANKIGTYMVALAAKAAGVPFYVAAPLSTFDWELPSGDLIPIEERDGDEVRRVGEVPVTVPGIPVFNPGFDVTPAELIAAIITERGVVDAPDTARMAAFRGM